MNGRIVHFEIPFDDGDRAKKFYGDCPRVEHPRHAGPMDYTFARPVRSATAVVPEEPGFINGGMFKRTDEVPLPVLTTTSTASTTRWRRSIAGRQVRRGQDDRRRHGLRRLLQGLRGQPHRPLGDCRPLDTSAIER